MSLDVNISEPEEFNCNELHSCIKEVAKMKCLDEFEYHVDFISGKGDNYIANIFRVLIKETGKDNSISVIVKTLVNTTRQELFHELHNREVLVYRDVIPVFKELQSNLEGDEIVMLPECLLSKSEAGKEILILDDLTGIKFEMDTKLAKFEKLDYLQVRLVMTELAKFHGLSFVLENKKPDLFDKFKNEFHDIIFQDSFLNKSKLKNYFNDAFDASLDLITDDEAKDKLEIIGDKLVEVFKKYVEPRKYNVLCHGDCWINNMLFKHEEKKQSQICLVDFQMMRYANPVTDIVYFIYLCTDSSFRLQYFTTLQRVYYDSLRHYLARFSLDARKIYPLEEFEKDIDEFLPLGLLIALVELRNVTMTAEDDAVLRGSNIVPGVNTGEVPGEISLLKIRVDDVVNEFVDNGILDKLVSEVNSQQSDR